MLLLSWVPAKGRGSRFQGTCRTQSGFGRTVLVLLLVLVIDVKKAEYKKEYEYEESCFFL
jgi:hypothetical protein